MVAVRPALVPGYGPASCDGYGVGGTCPAELAGSEGGRGAERVPPRLGPLEEVEEDQLVGKVPGLWR